MSLPIRKLEPSSLWNYFADLNAVPRASKKEEKVIEFMMDFGRSLGLETLKDKVGNVIIRKPATKGMENKKGVVLQSHLDMVHQKNNDTVFDFDTQGIDMYVDEDWVKANGTTLGADNGIGVAAIMAILASENIPHPAIEALFTIDEETGMTGAKGLEGGWLNGDILLNLDTEEDDEIDIGCAGGLDVTATKIYTSESVDPTGRIGLLITVKGLQGGHSGIDIHLGRGNANKIMNRLLYDMENLGLRVSTIEGGSLRNAIPRESIALVSVPLERKDEIETILKNRKCDIEKEFFSLEKNLVMDWSEVDSPSSVLSSEDQRLLLKAVYAAHNGVFRMSPDIKDLVEASNNVAKIEVKNGQAKILCLTRSSVESSKKDVALCLRSCFEMAGFEVVFSGDYPGWTPNIHSPVLNVLTHQYEKMFGHKAHVVACHAGLECGILGQNYPDMDMISFGPTIHGAHSPDEKVNIPSVQKFWNFTCAILQNIPDKQS
jgi:dipeptidase D